MERFGGAKLKWFKTFLDLPNDIPSHDTLGRVFELLDPDAFRRCFITWVESLALLEEGDVIAIDGKSIRRCDGRGQWHWPAAPCECVGQWSRDCRGPTGDT